MVNSLENNLMNGYYKIDETEENNIESYSARYKDFLQKSRTVPTVISNSIKLLEEHGFKEYSKGMPLSAEEKIYYVSKERALYAAVIGQKPFSEGVNILATHIDSPHLDLRPRPLVQTGGHALLKTHYYGWLRKYQWFSIPLMLTGNVYLANGEKVVVSIGDSPKDPVFVIPDLLPHISMEQNKLPLNKAHKGEEMNICFASRPLKDCEETKAVKLQALQALHDKYGMTERDFISAELELVPLHEVKDVGIDRSLIGGYGHDDRVCCYAALEALISVDKPEHSAVLIMADKEEVGNNGISGSCSQSIDYFFDILCKSDESNRLECYQNSFCLSGDVTSAFDPNFAEMFSKENTAVINGGIAVCKYTGFGGKENTSDAAAKLVSKARLLFEQNGVIWQSAEMGRIDLGGGGTVALEFANRGIDTLDAGVPVLGMHSTYEVVSKFDCYMTFKGYKAILQH